MNHVRARLLARSAWQRRGAEGRTAASAVRWQCGRSWAAHAWPAVRLPPRPPAPDPDPAPPRHAAPACPQCAGHAGLHLGGLQRARALHGAGGEGGAAFFSFLNGFSRSILPALHLAFLILLFLILIRSCSVSFFSLSVLLVLLFCSDSALYPSKRWVRWRPLPWLPRPRSWRSACPLLPLSLSESNFPPLPPCMLHACAARLKAGRWAL